jgi:hypothetical protein
MEDQLFDGFTAADLEALTVALERSAENMGLGPGRHAEHKPANSGGEPPPEPKARRSGRRTVAASP